MRLILVLFGFFGFLPAFAQQLIINEVLSANDRIIRDPEGDFDDYIELYNPSTSNMNIGGYFLTDNKDSLKKCQIPAATQLAPKGYLLIWIDGEMEQKGIHCSFKLNAKGERIILSDASLAKLDEINLKRQFADVAYGRIPNGGNNWNYLPPSPGTPNAEGSVLGLDRAKKGDKVKVKAGADKSTLHVEVEKAGKLAYRIADKEEKILLKGSVEGKGQISLSSLENGRYILFIGKSEYRILKQK
jgi:hypothetical protein